MEYRIGCSGYYYPQWKNKLYPPGVQSKDWLTHYSSVFNTVELNGTFYRMPKLSDLQKYARVTPENFRFSVKMSRYVTHVQRVKEKDSIFRFQDLILSGLGDKLQHFLFQMPSNFKFTEENLENIIAQVPHASQNVVELRHISWWNDTVKTAFNQANITFCNVDYPGLESWFIPTSPHFYLRLHGNPELFKTSYTPEKLKHIFASIPTDAQTISIYFNNTITEAGFQNALNLMSIAAKTAAR